MLEDFLKVVIGGKDVGLIVAADEGKLAEAVTVLQSSNFQSAETVADLLNTSRAYFVVGESLNKDVYDFIAQYGSGSVEIFDKTAMQSSVTPIDYVDRGVVFLVTAQNLAKVEAAGFGLRQAVGPVEQI